MEILSKLNTACVGSTVDWEPEESWGSILSNGSHLAFLASPIPILFAMEDVSINPYIDFLRSIVIVRYSNFENEEFSINQEILERIFNTTASANFMYERISANAIWFNTI